MKVSLIKYVDKCVGFFLVLFLAFFRRGHVLGKKRSILVIQLWGIGESICTLPAIAGIKKAFPKSAISVLTTNRNRAVYDKQPFIDRILCVDIGFFPICRFMFSHSFDVVLDFEEYLNISAIISYFVGGYRIGFSHNVRASLYDRTVPYDDCKHVAHVFANLVNAAGAKVKVGMLVALHWSKSDQVAVEKLLNANGISKTDFVVGVGAGTAESSHCRKWPLFAELSDLLSRKYNAKIVFVGSPSEVAEFDSIIRKMRVPGLNLAGKTSLPQLFCLAKRFDLFVGNDSGPMHISASQGIPTVGLFGPNLPERFGPFGKLCSYVYKGSVCKYSPCINVHKGEVPDCLFAKSSKEYQECMKAISVDDVMKTVSKVLRR
ncbi:MAG: glycosyltransferase family 9 protein [Candidatus Woesearchaeota archaeon]